MSPVYVDVEVSNPATPESGERVRVLVDTGATLSVLPASLLDGLGIRRIGTKRFQGFGGVVTRDVGGITMRYGEAAAGVTAIFGEDDDPAIMGVTALESMGYEVDPVAGKLNRVDILML